jgi:hypothetical protein
MPRKRLTLPVVPEAQAQGRRRCRSCDQSQSGQTARVAISNRRLIAFDQNGVTFRYKDYRADGRCAGRPAEGRRCKSVTVKALAHLELKADRRLNPLRRDEVQQI